jgi:multicomponent Na+:H+ antiporter subunit G
MTSWLAAVLLVSGGFFCLVAGLGVVRFTDTYQRMHASTKAGTLGLALVCLAVMVEAETWGNVVEALFVFLFMIATAPVGSHLIGRAAFRTRLAEDPRTAHDPGCDAFRGQPSHGASPARSRPAQGAPGS